MKKLAMGVLCLIVLLVCTGCASSGGVVPLPEGIREKVDSGCGDYEAFKQRYVEVRPEVIANGEWFRELAPKAWQLLVDFDAHAAEYDQVITLVCRVLRGDPGASAELQATRDVMLRRGVDWEQLIANATKVALLLL